MKRRDANPFLRLVSADEPLPRSPQTLAAPGGVRAKEPAGARNVSFVLEWLEKGRVPDVVRLGPNYLKIGDLNFYPSTGTIHRDNQPRMVERGLVGLKLVLERALKRQLPEF